MESRYQGVVPTGSDDDESHLALADREFCLGRLPSRHRPRC